MKPFKYILLIFLMAIAFSCSKDEEEDLLTKDGPFPIRELAGNWEATRAQFSTNTESVDLIAEGGTVSMSVQSSGRFILTFNLVDGSASTESGEIFWEEWQQEFYFAIAWDDYPDDWDTYGHTYDGRTLTISGGADTGEYDFDNDGELEPCAVDFSFVRS